MSNNAGPIELKKGDLLFDEGAPSDAMYVVKSGCIAIVKRKGQSEIELAKVMPGNLFGEMAFFDDKPRSAGARATKDSVVIALPFKALHAQFRQFPEWLKSMVKTVNDNLRMANKRIKELERVQTEAEQRFPPHTITKLCGIFGLVAQKFAEDEDGYKALSWNVLRRYTIQIFQEPTNKMEALIEVFEGFKILEVEKLGEGRKKLKLKNLKLVQDFTDFYNDYLFKTEDKRITISRKEIPVLKAIIFYGEKEQPQKDGKIKLKLDEIRKKSVSDLDYLVDIPHFDPIIEKGLISEKIQEEQGLSTLVNLEDIQTIVPYWELLFAIEDKDPRPVEE